MNNTKTQQKTIYDELRVSSERELPATSFPRKYVHCVIDDLDSLVQAVYALRADGHATKDIHVMASWDFIEAFEQKQQNKLAKMFSRLITFFDEGFGDTYLKKAQQGHHILMLRLPNNERLKRVCELLAIHHAHCIKYVDTWTVTDLSPALAYAH